MNSDEEPDGAVIVCRHVAEAGRPILRARRDEPEDEADTGWQVLCGDGGHAVADAVVWCLRDVLERDPDLRSLLGRSELGGFSRENADAPWTRDEERDD